MMALAIVISLGAIAMMMSLCGFPRSFSRFATGLRTGLWQAAASAAWNSTCHRDRRPPAIALLPRIAPLSCGTGTNPVMAAASPDAIRPSSGSSAISIADETGPIPGIDRRSFAFAAGGAALSGLRSGRLPLQTTSQCTFKLLRTHRSMKSAQRSPIITQGALVLPLTSFGMTEASAMRSRLIPRTRSSGSVTAMSSVPIRAVQEGW